MVSIADIKASNAKITADTVPHTAVLYGATDGIGKALLIRLLSTQLAVRVYVVGRNGAKHKPFLDELRKSHPKADIIWLEGQLSQLADTKRLCDEIKRRETSIDLIYMSAGFINAGNTKDNTPKNDEASLVLTYYGRMLTTIQLLPLLNASPNSPRVISVLGAGNESSSIFFDDLDLKAPEHSGLLARTRSLATYTTLSMSRLAKENPQVIFFHHYPGGVNTGIFKKTWGDAWFWPFLSVLLSTFGVSPEDAAEKVLYLSSSAKYGGKGVPLRAGETPEPALGKANEAGSLFLINDKLKGLYPEKTMAELEKKNAGALVWRKLLDTVEPYSS